MKKLRILHLPTNVGGNSYGLSRAERKLGHVSDCVSFELSFAEYPCDLVLFDKNDSQLLREFKRWALFLSAIRKYDVFHFNFGEKFFPWGVRPFKKGETGKAAVKRLLYFIYSLLVGRLDLITLRLLGKTVIMTWQGDDIRQRDYCLQHHKVTFVDKVDPGYYDDFSDRRKRRKAVLFRRYCRAMFSVNPDLLAVLPPDTRFVPYGHISPDEWRVTKPSNTRPLIVHAPSNRQVKGTEIIIEAMDRLKQRGFQFDFLMVEHTTNINARRIYEEADLLIDQLYAGWYGGVAVEAMALGKPVVCYIREEDLSRVPAQMAKELPLINASPATLEAVVEALLKSPDTLKPLGEKSRAFVEKWHNPETIAKDLVATYQS